MFGMKLQINYWRQSLCESRKLADPGQGVKAYWSALNRLINKKKVVNISPLLENGIFVTNVHAKANVFNDVFVEQCCSLATGSTLPDCLPRCNKMLQNIAVEGDKVFKLISNLNTNNAHGCDDMSASMIKIFDCSIVEPLCLIFEKCLDTGKYPSI